VKKTDAKKKREKKSGGGVGQKRASRRVNGGAYVKNERKTHETIGEESGGGKALRRGDRGLCSLGALGQREGKRLGGGGRWGGHPWNRGPPSLE